jgi:predicted  nucleic acid-binding Zn-ribbon protein
MKTNDLKIELSRKLAEVNSRIIVLKDKQDDLTEQSEALQELIIDLENIRDNILVQFKEIENTTEAEKTKLPQLEKNIYKSFTSFEESFSKAGSLTRSSRISSRDRSVDFKNPAGTR